MVYIVKEKYEDMLEYKLKMLEKSNKAAREASSFYIVSSNQNRKILRYDSFSIIPLDIRNDENNYEILKIRYKLQENRQQKSNMFAPRIIWRSGYSYCEKLLYNVLIKQGYYENKDFEHLYPIELKSLEKLKISNNQLESLPNSLLRLKNLKLIDLRGNYSLDCSIIDDLKKNRVAVNFWFEKIYEIYLKIFIAPIVTNTLRI